MSKIKELRLELGLSREELAKELLISPRTLMGWETGEVKPKAMTEQLILYKLENMVKEKNRQRTGLIMLDNLMDYKAMFTAEQAEIIAKAAIEYQLAWYKANNPADTYNYTPEILAETLKKISPEWFKEIDTGDIDAEELIKKEIAFINIKTISKLIEKNSVFIY